ncbi:hypothetical protein L0F63_004171 [Massospora cicadina]|nr:hypothetical protein L0F63_004171 [Massospora cicadina]
MANMGFSSCAASLAMKSAHLLTVEKPRLGRPSNNLKIGVVGLPNVGKSTFFNAVTNSSVPAENFPFCTIGAYEDSDVTHVEGQINPIRDLEIVHAELRIKDMEILTKHIEKLSKGSSKSDTKKQEELVN